MSVTYRTTFRLESPVNDALAAQRYLVHLDMTSLLRRALSRQVATYSASRVVEYVVWMLDDAQSGHIDVVTSEELHELDVLEVSAWISAQCSDGIGEAFEQQPFAEVDPVGYHWHEADGELEDLGTASFDWRTNDYDLVLVD